ncbi:MAG: threonine dehydratase [Alphaproteobacteria bacterium]
MLPSLADLEAATERVHAVLPPTPQIRWPLLCRRTGAEVWVKHENHQPIGAFKVRGGLIYMAELKRSRPDVTGVITATRGNHGQSVAFAAARNGLTATIVVPHGNSREKNAAMRVLGAELIEHGDDFQDALEHATALADRHGLFPMPSFHVALVCGVGTYSLELLRARPELDTVYVPIGLGSGICGLAAAREGLGLRSTIVGVVSAAAPAYALSFEARAPRSHPVTTRIADGMACRTPADGALEIIWRHVDRIVQVGDDEIEDAMRAIFTDTHNVAEGAGAAGLAALMRERDRMAGHAVGIVLTGGNVDRDVFARVLADHG